MTAYTARPMPPTDPSYEDRKRAEQIAMVVRGVATDVDAVTERSARAIRKLEKLDATPNDIVAVRRAVQALNEVAKAVRRDSLLAGDQQRLL